MTPSGASTESLLKLPASRASKRLQIQRHLTSGLAAVEALLPLGEGQRLGLVGPPGTGKSTALRTDADGNGGGVLDSDLFLILDDLNF